jgi:hypothetical protein
MMQVSEKIIYYLSGKQGSDYQGSDLRLKLLYTHSAESMEMKKICHSNDLNYWDKSVFKCVLTRLMVEDSQMFSPLAASVI